MLCGLYLRRRSPSVAIFEKRSEFNEWKGDWGGRSINLVLTYKALEALDEIGIKDLVIESAVPLACTTFHNPDGNIERIPYLSDCYTISRNALLEVLVGLAQGNDVEIYYDH